MMSLSEQFELLKKQVISPAFAGKSLRNICHPDLAQYILSTPGAFEELMREVGIYK